MIIIERHDDKAIALSAAALLSGAGEIHRVEDTHRVGGRWAVTRPVRVGDFLNHTGYSDVTPYQVVRVTKSGKTAYVRAVSYELDPEFKANALPGGFTGVTVNSRAQSYAYGDLEGGELAVRFGKRGWKSSYGPHSHSEDAYRYYDYNF